MEKRGTHPIPARRPRLEWRKPCRKRHSRRSAGRMQKPVAAVGARPTFAYINFSIITPSFATVNRANAPSDHGFSIILHPPKDTVIINRNRTHPGGPSAAGMQPRPGNTAPNPTIAPRAEGDSQGAKSLERSARQRLAVPPSPVIQPRSGTPRPNSRTAPRAEGDSQGAKSLERSARQRLAVPPSPAAPQTPCVPLRPKSQNRPARAIRARPQTHAPLPKANSAPVPTIQSITSPPFSTSPASAPAPSASHPSCSPARTQSASSPSPSSQRPHAPASSSPFPSPIIKATGASKDAPVAQSINSSRESEYRCTASCRYPPESACR